MGWNPQEIELCSSTNLKGTFSIDDDNGRENVTIKMNSRFFNFFRVCSELMKMSNVGDVPELVSWGPYSSLEKERKICSRMFTSSIKGKIRHFHVVVVQWRQINVQKSMRHVQSCVFAQ